MENLLTEFKNYENPNCTNEYTAVTAFCAEHSGVSETLEKMCEESKEIGRQEGFQEGEKKGVLKGSIITGVICSIPALVCIAYKVVNEIKQKQTQKKYKNKNMLNTVREA